MSISIFFPTLNDAPVLPWLIQRADVAARRLTKTYELIVINDGSTDDTKDVLALLAKKYKNLRAIHHSHPSGYGGALRSGFAAATKDWVFYTDGDGQYDPIQLTDLARRISPNIDVVNGYKTRRADPLVRRLTGALYNWLLHRLWRLPIRDIDCDFRLIRRSVLKKITLTSSSGVICLELILKLQAAGARFAEVPVHHYPRKYGQSVFFQWGNVYKTLKELMRSV
ncbi:glycosyltransferase family 2 protein [Candidatus Gottesmanbacteria bacterium]|nr:glycosyltransferase family 2 protein [Candidatus Gottesmanbacteria bacterium]